MADLGFTHHCHEMHKDGEKGDDVGGSADLATAVAIACAYFIAKQSAAASSLYGVGVFDSGETLVALIGKA